MVMINSTILVMAEKLNIMALGAIQNVSTVNKFQGNRRWWTNQNQSYILTYNFVEAHCYGMDRTGQLLSNHVAVETDGNVRRFNRAGLH